MGAFYVTTVKNYNRGNYKWRLQSFHLLPLTYWLELQDLCFLLKCFCDPHDNMNIWEYVSFSSNNTRAAAANKLTHNLCRTSMTRHFYFNRVVRLWNSLPNSLIDLTVSVESNKHRLLKYFWEHFNVNFDPSNHCSFHIVCPCTRCFLQ